MSKFTIKVTRECFQEGELIIEACDLQEAKKLAQDCDVQEEVKWEDKYSRSKVYEIRSIREEGKQAIRLRYCQCCKKELPQQYQFSNCVECRI